MALLAKHLRDMGRPDYAEARSGGVLRTEAKYAAPWAVSSDGTAKKTYDQCGLRRVRIEHSEYVIEKRKVVGEVLRKVGDVYTREMYMHRKHGLCGVIDARLNGSQWHVLLAVGEAGEQWIPLADCRGFGGVVSFKPGRSLKKIERGGGGASLTLEPPGHAERYRNLVQDTRANLSGWRRK